MTLFFRSITLALIFGAVFQPVLPAAEETDLAVIESAAADEPAEEDDTITMSFDGASLKDVLLVFSQKTGMNFIASQAIEQKKITVYFENVSPKEALDAILSTNNLAYSRKPGGSIYMVTQAASDTARLVTKVFRLKYARLSSSPLDIGGQQTVNDLRTMASAGSSGGSSGSSGASSGGSTSATGTARGIDSIARSFLSAQGRLALDIATNSLIITDTEETLSHIEKMLAELDVPQQQVILEVHVMEIQKGLISDKGVEWGGGDGTLFGYTGGAQTTMFPLDERQLQRIFHSKNQPSTVAAAEAADLLEAQDALGPQMMFGLIDATNFTAVLHYVVTDSKTKILARPRILTQNNEAAIIRLVTNTSIANQTETTTSTGTTSSSTNEAERSETGVTLRMTPQINTDDSVTLFLEPSVTTVSQSVTFTEFLDPTTRVVRTMARVSDNQTLVIGGLIDSNGSESTQKIPYLGDIPVLGRLFSYDEQGKQDRELIIFVTPHIVRGQNSLLQSNVTARGRDVLALNMLNEFGDPEADLHLSAYESGQTRLDTLESAQAEQQRLASLAAGRKAANPAIDQQMTSALDAFSPQLLDEEIAKALSFQSGKARSQSG